MSKKLVSSLLADTFSTQNVPRWLMSMSNVMNYKGNKLEESCEYPDTVINIYGTPNMWRFKLDKVVVVNEVEYVKKGDVPDIE
jgi:hypothetical protein